MKPPSTTLDAVTSLKYRFVGITKTRNVPDSQKVTVSERNWDPASQRGRLRRSRLRHSLAIGRQIEIKADAVDRISTACLQALVAASRHP